MATVTPLSDYTPERAPKKKRKPGGAVGPNNEQLHMLTISKYRAIWKQGEVWLSTREIEKRLRVGRCTVTCTLQKWADKYSIVERRHAFGSFSKRHGYEWAWSDRKQK
jgi:hypothetical protein